MSAERPSMDAINAVIFPAADVNTNNITTPTIELPADTVRHILVEEDGWWCSIIGTSYTFILLTYYF